MAPRKEIEPLTKVTLNVYARDYDRLKDLFPQIGPHRAIRNLVRQFIQKVNARAAAADELLVEDLPLDIGL